MYRDIQPAVQAAVAVFEELVAVTGTSAAAMFLKVEPGAVTRDTELVCACAGRGLQQLLALRQGAAAEGEAALRHRLQPPEAQRAAGHGAGAAAGRPRRAAGAGTPGAENLRPRRHGGRRGRSAVRGAAGGRRGGELLARLPGRGLAGGENAGDQLPRQPEVGAGAGAAAAGGWGRGAAWRVLGAGGRGAGRPRPTAPPRHLPQHLPLPPRPHRSPGPAVRTHRGRHVRDV